MRFRSPAAPAMTFWPVAVDPVKEILRTSGCAVSAAPRSFSSATMLTTPAGTMSLMSSPSFSEVSGVVGAGFSTTVLPARSAGGSLNAIRIIGKFHGTMAPMTPRGRRCASTFLPSLSSMIFTGRSSMVK